MTWTEVSPGIWQADYLGWKLTKIFLKKDVYGKEHHTYIAVLGNDKFTDKNEIDIKRRLLNSGQLLMF